MRMTAALLTGLLAFAGQADAQSLDSISTRAQGMAGAFVGGADDASAVYWNPAGIATGPIVSAVFGFGVGTDVPEPFQTSVDQRDRRAILAVSATAIGMAYYRFTAYGLGAAEPAVSTSNSREEVGRRVHAITIQTAGVSLLQSLTEHIVVAATPKFVRGADSNAFDVDAGVMVSANRMRLGLVARNLTRPAFAKATAGRPRDGEEVRLSRDVRAGAAWGSSWPGISRVIASADTDLTSRVTAAGDRRDVAAGLETWWKNQRLGLRGGVRRSTIGDARAAFAAGVSASLKTGMLVDAHVVRGHESERSWGVGLRMLF